MEKIDVKVAMEKQVPRAPVGFKVVEGEIKSASCPRCNNSFPDIGGVSEFYGEVEQYDYCPNCGQRIEWGKGIPWG